MMTSLCVWGLFFSQSKVNNCEGVCVCVKWNIHDECISLLVHVSSPLLSRRNCDS